jgi:trehalose 6-phosphate phosphatase
MANLEQASLEQARGPAPRPPPIPRADEIALFADIDGTLIDFAATPETVEIDATLPGLLRGLHAVLDGALAILSGRSLAQIDTLLHLPWLPVAAQHGAELRSADGRITREVDDPAQLDPARAALTDLLAQCPDLRLEDKGIALALHYRAAPQAFKTARQFADVALACVGPGFELLHGDCVIELKSARVDKGRTLAALMTQVPFIGRKPWMLGDDFTDEYAFAMAQSLGGVGVIVGPRQPSVARYALATVADTRAWLLRLTRHAARLRSTG